MRSRRAPKGNAIARRAGIRRARARAAFSAWLREADPYGNMRDTPWKGSPFYGWMPRDKPRREAASGLLQGFYEVMPLVEHMYGSSR